MHAFPSVLLLGTNAVTCLYIYLKWLIWPDRTCFHGFRETDLSCWEEPHSQNRNHVWKWKFHSELAAMGFPLSNINKMFNENVNAIPTQKINFRREANNFFSIRMVLQFQYNLNLQSAGCVLAMTFKFLHRPNYLLSGCVLAMTFSFLYRPNYLLSNTRLCSNF